MRLPALALALAATMTAHTQPPPPRPAATLLLRNGTVWTGDSDHPAAEAIAIVGDRIAWVGPDAETASWIGPETDTVDLDGRRVVPGFIDAHVHFLWGGDELLAPDLRTAPTVTEMARRLGEAVRDTPPGTWHTGGTWDHERWPGGELPTAADLDPHTPEHPVFVRRSDGHMAVANSLALRLSGVDADTPDVEGGVIVRDAHGDPAGVLKDAAMGLVQRHVPPWSTGQRLRRARAALAHAASLGVTGVHDMMSEWDDLEVYQLLRDRGELTTRITVHVPIADHDRLQEARIRGGFGDSWLEIAGVKGFADGSLGSTTALFFEPYADAPHTTGVAVTDLSPGGLLEQQVRACLEGGLQVAVHAIGDRAVREVLDVYERAGAADAGSRLRIEHAQHLHPDDLPRFAALGVVASMQPWHAADDGRWAEERIGAERCATTYAFRSLLDHGAPLAFGSDWPVAPLSPIEGLWAAVTRQTVDGAHPGGWVPEQRITVSDALRAYTRGSAFAGFDEDDRGILAPGKLADLVVLDRDPFTRPPESLREIRVERTVVGGRTVFVR